MNVNLRAMQKRLEFLELAVESLKSSDDASGTAGPLLNAGHHVQAKSRIGANDTGAPRRGTACIESNTPSAELLQMVEALIATRRQRTIYFETDFFFDPCWSMLLDLYRAELRQQQISVSSVCYASGVPETTALRHLRILECRGYVERVQDPKDKRRVFVRLSATGSQKLTKYFNRVNSEVVFAKR